MIRSVALAASLYAFLLPTVAAAAAPDAHCFARSSSAGPAGAEAEAFAEELQAQAQASEEEDWALRVSQSPWMRFTDRSGVAPTYSSILRTPSGTEYFEGRSLWGEARRERLREHWSRRTGSKHVAVTPEMKELDRRRSVARAFKPCNPHITYLGSN